MRLADTIVGSTPEIDRSLLPTELRLIAVRQHPAVLLGPFMTAVAGLAAAAFLTLLAAPGSQVFAVAVWFASGLLLLRAIQKAMGWSVDYFVVTSQRIMMFTGILTRSMAVIPFLLVNDVRYRRSLAGRLLGYGEFAVRYGAQAQVLQRIQYLPHPEQLYREIRGVLSGPAEAAAPDAEPAGNDQEI